MQQRAMRLRRFASAVGRPLLTACVLVFLAGCDAPASDATAPDSMFGDQPARDADRGREAFIGVIEARHGGGAELAVTYWIGSQRIRREIADVSHDGSVGAVLAGVIVDLADEAVVLYRAERGKRVSVRLTMTGYEDFLDDNRDRWTLRKHGIGSIFVGLSADEYRHDTSPDFADVSGYPCDRLTINQGENVVTVVLADHAPELYVPAALHGRVELDLPKEMAGFPLQVSRGEILKAHNKIDSDGEFAKLLRRAGDLVSSVWASATDLEIVVRSVQPREVHPVDFEAPEGFSALQGLDEFVEALRPPPSSSRRSHSFDDWD